VGTCNANEVHRCSSYYAFNLISKLMQILKKADIDRCKRRLLSKLYMDQIFISMTEPRGDKNGRGVQQGCLLQFLFKLHSSYLTKEDLRGLETSK
jgi:hypothetical protein